MPFVSRFLCHFVPFSAMYPAVYDGPNLSPSRIQNLRGWLSAQLGNGVSAQRLGKFHAGLFRLAQIRKLG